MRLKRSVGSVTLGPCWTPTSCARPSPRRAPISTGPLPAEALRASPDTDAAAALGRLETPATQPKPAEAIPTLRGRVLLAEDGPDNQRLITFLLTKAGLAVDLAENGRVALEKLRAAQEDSRPYDVVLMDMQMPDMDGLAATRAIRARERPGGSRLPVVALTAAAAREDRERCLEAGMDGFLAKPVRPEELRALLASLGLAEAPE